jgi:hypothetical protein
MNFYINVTENTIFSVLENVIFLAERVWTLKEEKTNGIVSVHGTEQFALNNI